MTVQFLEPRDIIKLVNLTKKTRAVFLGNMDTAALYRALFVDKHNELNEIITQKQTMILSHEKSLKSFREQDTLRNCLMNETSDETVKSII